MMTDGKETVVVTNQGSSGWFVAGIAIIALIVVSYMAYDGYFNKSEQVSIELKVPEILTPN